jgi:hypothetical protein
VPFGRYVVQGTTVRYRHCLDPEMLLILDAAFDGACSDLGVTDKTPHSRENLAKLVIKLADGQRDPKVIRQTAVAILKGRH